MKSENQNTSPEKMHFSTEKLIRHIVAGIQNGIYTPGNRISERAVGRELGVSQIVIRECMEKLVHEGWVERVPGKGIYVKKFNNEELIEMFEFRELLEAGSIYTLAKIISSEQLAVLRAKVEELESLESSSVIDDTNRCKVVDIEFHKLLVQYAGNKRVEQLFEVVIRQISLIVFNRGPSVYQRDLYCRYVKQPLEHVPHHRLLEALAEHNASEAEQLMREHIRSAADMTIVLQKLFVYGSTGASLDDRLSHDQNN